MTILFEDYDHETLMIPCLCGRCTPDQRLSVCHMTFLRCLERYDPSKGSFSGFYYVALKRALIKECRSNSNPQWKPLQELVFLINTDLLCLEEDARTVLGILMDDPKKFLRPKSPKTRRRKLTKTLQDSDWESDRIDKAFHQLQELIE